jgi:hypothetical protein
MRKTAALRYRNSYEQRLGDHLPHRKGTSGPISGVLSGAAAPMRITTALPPGFLNGSASIFSVL